LVIGLSAGVGALILAIIAGIIYIKKKPAEISNYSV
jgi:hypothetical protein